MALDLLAIISAAGTGAVTGYLTNNLALKMIFKEYGPLGGVVIKTKDEFIDSISALVERDLINHHTLKEEFSRPNFKEEFGRAVDDFINIHLEQHSSETLISEIPGFEDNIELLSSFSSEAVVDILAESSEMLKEDELSQLISKADQKKIIKSIYTKLLEDTKTEAVCEKLIISFYEQLENKTLAELLNPESKEQLKNLIHKINDYLQNNYYKLDQDKKNEFKAKIKELFELENLSKNLINEIKNIRISDLFKSQNEIKELLEGAKTKDNLKEILVNLKIEIDNSNLVLDDLITEDLNNDLKNEAAKIINAGESELLNFLNKEEENLNRLIFEAVEAEIESSTGFKAMSRQGIYSKYQENIDEYGLPLSHLKKYLKNDLNSKQQRPAAVVLEKLKKIRVKKLLENINLEAISDNLEALIWDFYQENKDKKIIELFSEEVFAQDYFTEKIIDLIFSFVKKMSSESEAIDILIDYVFEFKLQNLITKDKLTNKKRLMADSFYQLMEQEDVFTDRTAEYLNQEFFSIINKELNNSKAKFGELIKNYFSVLETKLAGKELSSFYRLFKKNPEAVADLTESISTFFYNNLPGLLEGKIAEAASTNLHQLSDQEVQAAIEDFMGKELKPITYLGALLGAAAGIIFSLSGAETAIFAASPVWVDYLSSALLYGGVGWLTNVLAIWMIFNPYQEKNIMGVKLPFTPGIVAKNRSRFANSMGEFVEKELLKANSAAEIIDQNHAQITNTTIEFFEENNYQQFFELLVENNGILAETILNKTKNLILELDQQKLEKIMKPLNKEMNKLLQKKVMKTDFETVIKDYLKENHNSLTFDTLISNSFNLDKIIAAAAGEYNLEFNSKELKNFMKNKELYPMFKLLAPYLLEKEINFDLKDYILGIFRNNSNYYLDQSLSIFLEQQERAARLINFKKDEIIEKEKEKKGGLLKNTMISGAIYMADLDEFIDSVVERFFEKMQKNYFMENRVKLEKLYISFIDRLEVEELLTKNSLKLNQILKKFLNTEAGAKFLTDILYLNDDALNKLIDLTFKSENKKLFSLDIEINAGAAKFFINEHLNLEQKLELLIQFKKLVDADNIEKEIIQLSEKIDFKVLNQELEKLIENLNLTKIQDFNQDLFNEIKKNGISLINDEELKELLISKIEVEILKISEFMEAEMNRDSLKYVLTLFVEAGVDSFKTNSEALLSSLELKELTAVEVRKMNPAEIEAIFDSFAGKYFAQLKQYGWFGGVFGVLQLLLRTII
jgi:uncharacterized membrane protein YheB (UPF0754 family)